MMGAWCGTSMHYVRSRKYYLLNLSLCLIFRNNLFGVICMFSSIPGTKVLLSCEQRGVPGMFLGMGITDLSLKGTACSNGQ